MSTTTVEETWNELVTVGLLGTDRRDPPQLGDGPVAELVADALGPTPQSRMLTTVAATTIARRSGAKPLPPAAPPMVPDADARPMLPLAAARRWRHIVSDWPLLEAEWLAVAAAGGWRPAPDVLVALLRRHQRSPVVAGAVIRWGQPLAGWLIEHLPELAPWDRRRAASPASPAPLPVPADLEPLLPGPPDRLVDMLVDGLLGGRFRWSHRAVLLNVVVRMPATSLTPTIDALASGREQLDARDEAAPLGIWEALIELAGVRRHLLAELEPAT